MQFANNNYKNANYSWQVCLKVGTPLTVANFILYHPILRQTPLEGGSLPAVAFLDWNYSICRLCL